MNYKLLGALIFLLTTITSCGSPQLSTKVERINWCASRGMIYQSGSSYRIAEEANCEMIGDKCRYQCRNTFRDLYDTWATSNTSQDTLSKSILECVQDCKGEYTINNTNNYD